MKIKIIKRIRLPKNLKSGETAIFSPSDETYHVGTEFEDKVKFFAKYGYIEIIEKTVNEPEKKTKKTAKKVKKDDVL